MKVVIDQEKCIGCGSCQAVCPDVFGLDDDGKAYLKENSKHEGEVDGDCIQEAAEICPVEAIQIEKTD